MSALIKTVKKNKLGRSLLSVILAVAVLCSTLSMIALIPAVAVSIWDGTIADSLSGSGTESDPYLISDGSELAYAITKGGQAYSHYKITEDIYLNDTTKINWSTGEADTGYTPNSWYEDWYINNRIENGTDFQGVIDGNGKVIYGLYYNETVAEGGYSSYYAGAALIPKVLDGGNVTIKNLGMNNAYVHDNTTAAAFIGVTMGSTTTINVDSCYVGAEVTLKSASAGAIRGYGSRSGGGSITNCYSLANLEGSINEGLVAFSWENSADLLVISNCYNANGVMSTQADADYNISFSNSYESVASPWDEGVLTLDVANMQGADVFTNAAKMPNLNLTGAYEAVENDYPVLKAFNAETPDDEESDIVIWDGSIAESLSGSGTESDPYLISDGSELAYAITKGGQAYSHYKITEDIYLNDTTKINWSTGVADTDYTPNSWYEVWFINNRIENGTDFQGAIDGNGKVIYGLYYNETVAEGGYSLFNEGAALIPRVKEGANVTIKNLGMDNVYVHDNTTAAAFVGVTSGQNTTLNMDSCFVGANATLKSAAAGALRGYSRESGGGSVTNCYSFATTVGVNASGLIAYNWELDANSMLISNCYNANGPVSTHDDAYYYVASENNYASEAGALTEGVTVLSAENMQGADVFTNAAKMPNLNLTGVYEAVENDYPILKVFKEEAPEEDEQIVIWDGQTQTQPQGEGTEASPYLISNGAELAWAIANGATVGADKLYKLTADIYLNDTTKIDWTTGAPVGDYTPNSWFDNASFSGTIDGDGHVVYGLYYKTDANTGWSIWGNGLIPKVSVGKSVSISNLGIENSYLSGKHGVSAFVGAAGDNVSSTDRANITIDQCYVGATVTLKGYDVGAFRGASRNSNTTIKNSYSLANIQADGAYGLVGSMWTVGLDIDNCYIVGAGVTTEAWVAGVANVYATSKGLYTGEVVELTTDNMKGADVFTDAAKMPNLNADGVYEAVENDYPVLKVFAKSDEDQGGEGPTLPEGVVVWDGQTQTQPQGEGTEASPYLVSNGAELAWTIAKGGSDKYYKLTADIYLNDTTKIDWTTGAPVGDYTPNAWFDNTSFSGTIDGDGYVVYGLYQNTDAAAGWGCTGVGLIPRVDLGKTVKVTALGVDKSYVAGINGVSAFVGFAGATSNSADETEVAANRAKVVIDQCYVGSEVTLKGNAVGAFRGGSFGSDTTITNSYSLASLNTNGTAGLIGNHWNVAVAIENSFNANGAITSDNWLQFIDDGLKNVYATNKGAYVDKVIGITADNMKGADVFTNEAKMPNLNAGNAFVAQENDYPVLKVFTDEQGGEEPGPGEGGEEPGPGEGDDDDQGGDEPGNVEITGEIWDGETVTAPSQGDGSKKSPYLISTPAELAWTVSNGGQGKYYKLTADIYLNDINYINWTTGKGIQNYVPNSWYDNVSFEGTIDGNGHVVYGLYYKGEGTPTWGFWGEGLIPRVEAGKTVKITGLGVDYAYVSSVNGASAFVGFAGTKEAADAANVIIDQCYAGKNVTIKGNDAGALRGGTYNSLTSITNSYSLATLDGASTAGLIGNLWSANVAISNAFNANGAIISDAWLPAVDAGLKNVYATDKGLYVDKVIGLTADQMQGAEALTNMPDLNEEARFVATEAYPQLIIFTDLRDDEEGGDETETPDYVWDGLTSAPTQGDGTRKNPYLISTAEELAYVVKSGGEGKYYKLTADIYLNDINKVNWATGNPKGSYEPLSWFDNVAFEGTINGDGHVIYGLYFKTRQGSIWGYTGQGLIPRVNPGKSVTISELGIDYAYVSGPNGASAFVGFAGPTSPAEAETSSDSANVSIRESYVGANVTVKGNDAGAFRGATKGATTIINNCYSLGNMDGASTDGLIGNIWEASVSISNSFNANGAIISDTWLSNIDAGLKNVYATDKGKYIDKVVGLTTDNMKGLDVFTNAAKMPKLNEEGAFVVTEGYPILMVFSDIEQEEIVPEEPGDIWNGTVAKEFAEGEGTKDNPYIISTGSELAYAVKNNGFGGKYFKLSHDIYLNDVSNKLWYMNEDNNVWFADGAGFEGHIDGNGHIVYGVWYSEDTEAVSAGLVPVFKSGSITNIGVRNAQINAKQFAAGIVGKTVNGGNKLVSKCFADETVYVATNHIDSGVAGIVGMVFDGTNNPEISTTIENCYSKASLSGVTESRKNGIVGGAWRTPYSIRNCYSVGYPVYTASTGGEVTSAYWDYAPAYLMDENGDYIRDDGGYLIEDKEKYINKVRKGVSLSTFIYNNYSDVGTLNEWTLITVVDRESMSGESARTVMPKLDYVNVYQVVNGGTPKLKIFTSIDGKDIVASKDADFFGKGSGTLNDPFIITTADHLRYVVESLDTKGKYYKLGNDIYVNNTKNANWMNNNPEPWYSNEATHSFAGNLDGNGYKIYGLYVNEETTKYDGKGAEWINHGTALFPYADVSASIRNVHIRDSYLSGKGSVGGIVGNILGADKVGRLKLVACSVDESVTLKGFTVGGLIGASHTGGIDLTYCYATAKMSNTGPSNRLSGLVGDIWGAKISAFEAYTTDYQVTFGSLVNTTALYAPVDQLGVTVLEKSDMIGDNAKKNMDFTWDKVWYTVKGKTPQLKVVPYGEEESLYDEGKEGRVWSGKISTEFGGGDGTKENPYLIYTPEQMARIFAVQSSDFTCYKLMADLKLNDTSKENWEDTAKMWYAGQYVFRGVFDGNGHVVSGLYYKNENNEDNSWAGLFQAIGASSTIKRLGVTQSKVINKGPNVHSYAAAICAYLEHWRDRGYEDAVAPVISECFGDDSVYLEATAAAGILAATQTEVIIENCYFTGELTGSTYAGAMVADNWAAAGHGPTIRNCYGATLDGDPLGDGYGTGAFNDDTVNDKRAFLSNCYIAGSSLSQSITPISVMFMKGEDAKEYMPGLDYNKIWKTVKDGTPVLRCFKNADKYASVRNPREVVITFGNLGDAVVEPLRGYPGYTPISVEDLPIPERRGFIFNGWHHHNPDGCEFELTVFPNYDITLFANWTEVGFTQNFDKELDEKYDYNEGIEIFKPGLPNYDTKYVHSGWRSLHTLKDSAVDPEFLVSYENTLLVGYEYEISFWMTTDEDNTTAKLFFEQSNYGDVYDEIVGYQEAGTYTGLKAGEWKQYKVKIVANAPYLIVRAEKGTSLFFEDFEAIPTGAKGELGGLIGYNPGASGNAAGLAPWLIVIIVCGAVLVLGGATVVTIVLVKKKKA